MARYKHKTKPKMTLATRRWLNRYLIWPMRKINRLIIEYDKRLILIAKKHGTV